MTDSEFVLGISTAGPVELALVGRGHDITLASDAGALESLAELLSEALRRANAALTDLSLVGICTGPGSFTGLRIGVSFAKTLAQTLSLPIAGISSYDVAAHGMSSYPIISVARGKRDHYYARIMTEPQGAPRFIAGPRVVIERVAVELGASGLRATIVGPDFSHPSQGSAARAVAELARTARERGADMRWTNIAIDYGQRPNAVANWERRRKA